MTMKNENARVVSAIYSDTVLSKEKTVSEGERATYMLLADHPYFIVGVHKIRASLNIPLSGFADGQKAYTWEHENKTNKNKLWIAVEKLVAEFKIKPAFQNDVKFFVYSYTLSPRMVENQLPLPRELPNFEKEETIKQVGRHKIGARLIQTSNDIERNKYQFKTNAVYLEITSNTTTRDVAMMMKEATKHKNDVLPFDVPKPEIIARRVWQLKQEALPDKEVAKIINREFRKHFGYSDIPVYHKRYRDALQKLKPFNKK